MKLPRLELHEQSLVVGWEKLAHKLPPSPPFTSGSTLCSISILARVDFRKLTPTYHFLRATREKRVDIMPRVGCKTRHHAFLQLVKRPRRPPVLAFCGFCSDRHDITGGHVGLDGWALGLEGFWWRTPPASGWIIGFIQQPITRHMSPLPPYASSSVRQTFPFLISFLLSTIMNFLFLVIIIY